MTGKQLVNHLCYEYNIKNYNEERLKASQEIKKDLEVLEILKPIIQASIHMSDYGINNSLLALNVKANKRLKEWLKK